MSDSWDPSVSSATLNGAARSPLVHSHDECDVCRFLPVQQVLEIVDKLLFGEEALLSQLLQVMRIRQALYKLQQPFSPHSAASGT